MKQLTSSRAKVLALTLSLVLLAGCSNGVLRTFRVGASATLPFVAALAAENVITQAVAGAVTADINDGIDAAVNCDRCLKAIPSSVQGTAKQAAKAKCYVGLASSLRSILNRHNIGGVEQLERIARIIEAGIGAFEEYARDVGQEHLVASAPKAKVGAESQMKTDADDPDKTLKDAVNKMKDDMREATKSPDGKSGKFKYLIPKDDRFLLAD